MAGWVSSALNSSKKRKASCFSNTALMRGIQSLAFAWPISQRKTPWYSEDHSTPVHEQAVDYGGKTTWSALSMCFRDHPSRASSILQGPHCVHHGQRQVTRAWRKRNWRWYQVNEPFCFCFCYDIVTTTRTQIILSPVLTVHKFTVNMTMKMCSLWNKLISTQYLHTKYSNCDICEHREVVKTDLWCIQWIN